MSSIVRSTSFTYKQVNTRLKRSKIEKRGQKMIPQSEVTQVVDLYNTGLSMNGIVKSTPFTTKQVRLRLERGNIECRSPGTYQKKYYFNEDFFETIDSEKKAYWLGFIAADGCVTESSRKRLIIKLARKDRGHLVQFLQDIEATNPVKDKDTNFGHPCSIISLCSGKIFSDLVDKGIMPKKTFKLKAPTKVPDNLIHHWVRGYFDGDGSVYIPSRDSKPKPRVAIYGNFFTLLFFREIFLKIGIDRPVEPKGNIFFYRLGKRAHVEKFANYIYKDATVFLERKKLVFDSNINDLN